MRRGEILGIAGLVGAGRSETMECIFGLTKRTGGQVWIEGNKVCFNHYGSDEKRDRICSGR